MGNPKYEARYFFEHKLLPQLFYEGKIGFLNAALKEENYLYNICNEVFKAGEMPCPYEAEQFELHFVKVSNDKEDHNYMMVLEFPEPEEPVLCHRAIAVFDMDFEKEVSFEKTMYYTVEKTFPDETRNKIMKSVGIDLDDISSDTDDAEPMLCGWAEDGKHLNFGYISNDIRKQVDKVLELYSRK